MASDKTCLSRSDLYDLIWQKPISQLAREYGISDVGLKKICVRHRVPLPGRGYWAKRRAGRNLPKQPLPNLPTSDSSLENICIHRTGQSKVAEGQKLATHPELAAIAAREADPNYRISVPERLTRPHPLVRQAKLRLKKQRPFTYGRVKTTVVPGVGINVSPAGIDRACRVMDVVFKALLKRRYEINEPGPHGQNRKLPLSVDSQR